MERNSLQYFASEVANCLKQMGFKPFWTGQTPILAKKAIATQYLSLKLPPAEMEKAFNMFQIVLSELVRRADFLGYNL